MPEIHPVKGVGNAIIITPETDIDNRIVIDFIKKWQRETILSKEMPPIPTTKNDWMLLWEWEARHPSSNRKDIAQIIGKSYVNVKRKLESIDKEME